MADAKQWQHDALLRLEELLGAGDAAALEALRARLGLASVDEVAKARKLLLHVIRAMDAGDTQRFKRLALAFEVIDVGVDDELEAPPATVAMMPDNEIDTTLPAGACPITEPFREPQAAPPAQGLVDKTLAVGELRALEDDDLATADDAGHAQSRARAAADGAQTDSAAAVLDLEKYAILCAWCQAHPERREALNRRYGLRTDAERAELDGHFAALFARDAALRAAFEQRLSLHLGWIRKARGS